MYQLASPVAIRGRGENAPHVSVVRPSCGDD